MKPAAKKEFFVYALVSLTDGVIYVGMATNCEARLKQHNSGKSKYTSGHCPWKLFFKESAGESCKARVKEKYYKSATGKKRLREILAKADGNGSLPA